MSRKMNFTKDCFAAGKGPGGSPLANRCVRLFGKPQTSSLRPTSAAAFADWTD